MRALVVPGVIEFVPTYVGAQHTIVTGPLAGYRLDEDVTNWKNTYTFAALADLSLEDRVRYAPRFAEIWRALAGPDGYRDGAGAPPRLTALLSAAELLLVDSTDGRDLSSTGDFPLDGPHRVFEVGFMRTADDFFHLRATRGKQVLASVSGAFYSISAAASVEDLQADRVLRAATGGLVSGAQIALAFMMADVVDVAEWERYLASVEEAAAADRALGGDVVRVIAASDEDVVELPVYGTARRTRVPARTLRSAGSADGLEAHIDLEGASELALPAEDFFVVDAELAPPPPMPRGLFAPRRLAPPTARRGGALPVLFAVLCALIVVFLLLKK